MVNFKNWKSQHEKWKDGKLKFPSWYLGSEMSMRNYEIFCRNQRISNINFQCFELYLPACTQCLPSHSEHSAFCSYNEAFGNQTLRNSQIYPKPWHPPCPQHNTQWINLTTQDKKWWEGKPLELEAAPWSREQNPNLSWGPPRAPAMKEKCAALLARLMFLLRNSQIISRSGL